MPTSTVDMAWWWRYDTHRMPLINIPTIYGDAPYGRINLWLHHTHGSWQEEGCTHYIYDLFEEQIVRSDKEKMYTDFVFFDGTSNMQKTGRMLNHKYPRVYALTGGKYVISSFFSDLVKMRAINVCCVIPPNLSICLLIPDRFPKYISRLGEKLGNKVVNLSADSSVIYNCPLSFIFFWD